MSMTVTMAATQLAPIPEYEVLTLKLRAPVEDQRPMDERVATIVETMLASDHLSEEEKLNLAIWLRVNLSQFATQPDGSLSEELADDLCSLLVDFIRPLMLKTDEQQALEQAIRFEGDVKELLHQILSIGVDVDEYIFQYEELNEEYHRAQEAKKITDEATEDLIDAQADAVWDRGGERFTATRDFLEEAIHRREIGADEVDSRVRAFTSEVKGTSRKLHAMKLTSEQQIERMRAQLATARALALASGSKLTMGAIQSL